MSPFKRLSDWFRNNPFLASSGLLFASMTLVNAGNYLFNLILGRWLGPEAFADLSLIVTLMLMVTLITATLQLIATKFAAVFTAESDKESLVGLRRWLGRISWLMGIGLMVLFVVGSPLWKSFFHTQSVWPFVILGVGLPLYFAQGVDRGVLQGQTRFGLLAVSYQAEMWARLVAAVILVALGLAVNGAVAGLTISFVATWLVARRVGLGLPETGVFGPEQRRAALTFAGPAGAALIGQILINNSDILIVKRYFEVGEAGQYAALALIGRVVFFATWSVVATLFPIVAQRHQRGERHRHLLWLSLGLVAVVSVIIIVASLLIPEFIVNVLFGEAYLSITPLLWLYAVATMFYALSNVVVNYRLSVGNNGGSAMVVFGGVAQVVGLLLFHGSLREVVMVQIYIMAALTLLLLIWDLMLARRPAVEVPATETMLQHIGAEPLGTLVVGARTEDLAMITPFIEQAVSARSSAERYRIALAVHEVCMNIIQHGYAGADGDIVLNIGLDDGAILISIKDNAPNSYVAIERTVLNPFDLPERGWGLFIVNEVMDEVHHQVIDGGNRWVLKTAG